MKKTKLGVTLLVVCTITGATIMYGCIDRSGAAENLAMKHCKKLGIKIDKAVCAREDTDGDGYISCTVNINGEMIPLECNPGWFYATGCRTPKLNIRRKTK